MPRQVVNSAQYHVPVPAFTQAVKAPANGTFIFLSGITAREADGTIVATGDIEGQTRHVLEKMKVILAEAGATMADVVKITTFVRDANDISKVSEIRRQYFGEPVPASSTVEVSRLFDPDQLIEMEAIAVV